MTARGFRATFNRLAWAQNSALLSAAACFRSRAAQPITGERLATRTRRGIQAPLLLPIEEGFFHALAGRITERGPQCSEESKDMREKKWMWEPGGTAHFVKRFFVDPDPRGTGVDDLDHWLGCGKRIETYDPRADSYSFGTIEDAEGAGVLICGKCLASLSEPDPAP